MSDLIQNMINKVLDDGARASKYACIMTVPAALNYGDPHHLDILCKTASFPTKMVEAIQLKYKGRSIPIIGQERFVHALDLTFYLEENHKTRLIFEKWMQALNFENYNSNITNDVKSVKNAGDYLQPSISIAQLNFEGETQTMLYTFYNVFPREISAMNLDSSTVDTLLEYTVTFSYTHYDVKKIESGMNGNELANSILSGIQSKINSVVTGVTGQIAKSLGLDSKAATMNSSLEDKLSSVGSSLSSAADDMGTTIQEWLR